MTEPVREGPHRHRTEVEEMACQARQIGTRPRVERPAAALPADFLPQNGDQENSERTVLAVPNAKPVLQTPRRLRTIFASERPWDSIQKLGEAELATVPLPDRVALIRAILDGKGLGRFESRINNAKEQKILRILESAPAKEQGPLYALLREQNLVDRIEDKLDFNEHEQWLIFAKKQLWALPVAAEIAADIERFDCNREEALAVLAALKERKDVDDAFREGVCAVLYSKGLFARWLPQVYWRWSHEPECAVDEDLAKEAGWQAAFDVTALMHHSELDKFLQLMPRSSTRFALERDFSTHHNRYPTGANWTLRGCAERIAATKKK